jgi:hypothetical protein
MLYSLLEHMPARMDKEELELGAWLDIRLCREYMRNKGVYVSNASVLEFNDFIYLELVEEIARYTNGVASRVGIKKYKELYIRMNRGNGDRRVQVIRNPDIVQYLEKKEIIFDILRLYDINEDDLPFERIKKSLQRLKLPVLRAS